MYYVFIREESVIVVTMTKPAQRSGVIAKSNFAKAMDAARELAGTTWLTIVRE